MIQQDRERTLASLSAAEQSQLLALLGHELTVLSRYAYEFQGPGVTDPRLLRDLSEIQHRGQGQLFSLVRRGEPDFPADLMASWLFGEGKPHLQTGLASDDSHRDH